MKHVAFALLVTSGLILSFNILRDEKKKIRDLECGVFVAERLCTEIENYKTPISHILEDLKSEICLECNVTPEELPEFFDRLCRDGGKAKELALSLMEKNYEGAVISARKLSAYLDELFNEKKNEYKLKKTARAVIPAATGLLAGILII